MLHVVLIEPEIPPNTGNIGRLCLSTDSRLHLVGPLGFSLDDKSLRRAGLDYWSEVDVHLWESFEALRQDADPSASFYFLTTKTEHSYWDTSYKDGDYLVFGPETRGLAESLLSENHAHARTIPQRNGRSLNLATAVGIVLYEAIRQLETS